MNDDLSPENIARDIFLKAPGNPCSGLLLSEKVSNDPSYLFEIIINIIMEGMDLLIGGLDSANFDNFSEDHILVMNPWMHSLGITIKTEHFNLEDKHFYSDYYCKVIVKNSEWNAWFDSRGISKNFHFLLNAIYANGSNKINLSDHYAIFILNDSVFKITFDIYNPPSKNIINENMDINPNNFIN
jgi:hypothetical protein